MAVSRDLEAPTVVNDPTADDAVVEKKEYADGTPANDPFGNEECGEVKISCHVVVVSFVPMLVHFIPSANMVQAMWNM